MSENTAPENQPEQAGPFFARPGVRVESIPIGPGVPIGIERMSNPDIGIGGAYGTWGACCYNASLPALVEDHLGDSLGDDGVLNLSELGFMWRHHVPDLSVEDHVALEVEVGARFLREAAAASGWEPWRSMPC